MTYTAGTSSTPYGFTGETTDANGLIYLRARYYNPADARFISRDTWGGDAKSPLSLNRWMYVEGNPVNLIDSTGLKPCQMQGGGRYCILNKGGLIDMNHYRGGRNHARDLINKLSNRERWGKDDEPLDINQDLFGPIPYSLVYRTSIPKDGFPDGYQIINRVALGIFMDFQIRYENFQGLDPRCRNQALEAVLVPVFDGYCSSFAAEDLLSDYLGFIDFIRDDINFDSIVTSLGGGYASSKHPRGYFRWYNENCVKS
ncbi:MAG: RHS repeat-associated core domain-containing protein [Anaerolineales bacterium]|nr:RHS repeat-associated core domain-containing protein [Anaerolineales bacterium]